MLQISKQDLRVPASTCQGVEAFPAVGGSFMSASLPNDEARSPKGVPAGHPDFMTTARKRLSPAKAWARSICSSGVTRICSFLIARDVKVLQTNHIGFRLGNHTPSVERLPVHHRFGNIARISSDGLPYAAFSYALSSLTYSAAIATPR
jgi:hypothetical protein